MRKYSNIKKIKKGFTPLEVKALTGFTLLETLVAIFVITVGLMGVMTVLQMTMFLTSISSSRLTAVYLAQEGIEIVRNIRDTNWLQARDPMKNSPWDDGLVCAAPPCDWQADYTTITFTNTTDFEKCTDSGYNCYAYNEALLKSDGGFFNYTSVTETKFKRKITITAPATPECPAADCRSVKVEVIWSEKGKPYNFSAQENLYNWR